MKTIFNVLLLLVCMNQMLTSCILVRHRITETNEVIPTDFGSPNEVLILGQIDDFEYMQRKILNLFSKTYNGQYVTAFDPVYKYPTKIDISDSTKFRFVMDIPLVGGLGSTLYYHIQITDKLTGQINKDNKKTSNPGTHLKRYIKVLNEKLATYHR
jgi:hypothetical protein